MSAVEVGDIWRKNGKDYRVKGVSTWGDGRPTAGLHPVSHFNDQWNLELRRVPMGMHLKYHATMAETMELVERGARYHLNYVCPETCHCWGYRNSKHPEVSA